MRQREGGRVDDAATLRGDLEQAVVALEPAQREAFLLVVVVGLSYQEVAAITGAPVGTVASRVFRARTQLAVALGAQEEDPA
jgi:RNA polymerase sigma-70 factor (ECF subfamily)